MKKFGNFIKGVFTRNMGLKFLALVLAALAVMLINV